LHRILAGAVGRIVRGKAAQPQLQRPKFITPSSIASALNASRSASSELNQ
jgi:hypothetical protein